MTQVLCSGGYQQDPASNLKGHHLCSVRGSQLGLGGIHLLGNIYMKIFASD